MIDSEERRRELVEEGYRSGVLWDERKMIEVASAMGAILEEHGASKLAAGGAIGVLMANIVGQIDEEFRLGFVDEWCGVLKRAVRDGMGMQ